MYIYIFPGDVSGKSDSVNNPLFTPPPLPPLVSLELIYSNHAPGLMYAVPENVTEITYSALLDSLGKS